MLFEVEKNLIITTQGWINDENPLEKASKIAKNNHFQTPIDEIDAAARILDPIFVGIAMDLEEMEEKKEGSSQQVEGDTSNRKKNEKRRMKDYGKFYKDYRETEW